MKKEEAKKNGRKRGVQYNKGAGPAAAPKKKKLSLVWYIVAGLSLMIIGAAIALVLSRSGKDPVPSDTGNTESHAVVNNETTVLQTESTPVTTASPVAEATTTGLPVTEIPTTASPTTEALTTEVPETETPTTTAPETEAPTTAAPTTPAPTTVAPTAPTPTTPAPTTTVVTTAAPTTPAPTTTTAAPTTLEIVQQPASVTVYEGENAIFSVVAQGDGVQYEWEASYDSGATWGSWDQYTSSITVYGKENRDGRLFRCKVWDRYGNTIYSDVAVMGVIVQSTPAPLVIVQQPVSVTVHEGENAVFTVVAQGDGVQYEWEASYDSGTTWGSWDQYTSSITVYGKPNRDGRLFRCKVSDQYGNVIYSDAALMRVIVQSTTALEIIQQPIAVAIYEDENAVFSVVAQGDGVQYEWEASYDSGATWGSWEQYTSSITVYGKPNRDGRMFRCKVSDQHGNVIYSVPVVLTVLVNNLVINYQPQDVYTTGSCSEVSWLDIYPDGVFTVQASGTNLQYQWEKMGADGVWGALGPRPLWTPDYSGESTNTLEIFQVDESELVTYYRCIITDGNGNSVTSRAAMLTVEYYEDEDIDD